MDPYEQSLRMVQNHVDTTYRGSRFGRREDPTIAVVAKVFCTGLFGALGLASVVTVFGSLVS